MVKDNLFFNCLLSPILKQLPAKFPSYFFQVQDSAWALSFPLLFFTHLFKQEFQLGKIMKKRFIHLCKFGDNFKRVTPP